MTREELEKKYVDLVYAHVTSDYSRMADFVWDTLNDNVEEMDDDTLHDLIEHYSDEEEIL
jgi:hypothetical protein